MKIYIKQNNSIPLFFYIPNFLLNGKILNFIYNHVIRLENNLEEEQTALLLMKDISHFLDILKNSVREFGHYELVHVETKDGLRVIIKM